MNTENNDWILTRQRYPTAQDMPVFVWRDEWSHDALPIYAYSLAEALKHDWWQRAKRPWPPLRAKTQREEDVEAARAFAESPAFGGTGMVMYAPIDCAFLAGVAHRDAQNRADLESLGSINGDASQIRLALTRLRKRAGLET